jgi:alkylhydroperoxidase family enzyme
LSADEVIAARRARASTDKADAALKFARAVTLQRGQISDAELQTARSAGLSDAEIVEIIVQVALCVLTNYTNIIARTVLDFPEVRLGTFETAPVPVHAAV